MSDVIPTAEEAASAADVLSDYVRISFDQIPRQIRQPLTDAIIGTVSPLLEAIAEGRVFEVRRELCTECDGDGFFEQGDDRTGETESEFCKPCKGTGLEPDPPGRPPARTAYDAMIEAAAEGGA